MWTFLLVLLLVSQVFVMAVDEFYFHHKRGLGGFERLSHPVDTLFFLSCLLFIQFTSYAEASLMIFVCLAIATALITTKDEWVHTAHCSAGEHWLHAILFILNPTLLIAMGAAWWQSSLGVSLYLELFKLFTLGVAGFFIYQILFWLIAPRFFPKLKVFKRAHGEAICEQ